MNYKIKGDSDCPIVEINLQNNETVKIERGSMAYMLLQKPQEPVMMDYLELHLLFQEKSFV